MPPSVAHPWGVMGVQLSAVWRVSICHILAAPRREEDEEALRGLYALLTPCVQGAAALYLVFWWELGGLPRNRRYHGAFLTLGH